MGLRTSAIDFDKPISSILECISQNPALKTALDDSSTNGTITLADVNKFVSDTQSDAKSPSDNDADYVENTAIGGAGNIIAGALGIIGAGIGILGFLGLGIDELVEESKHTFQFTDQTSPELKQWGITGGPVESGDETPLPIVLPGVAE